uniref:Uncharacterized protein n=1 Tax=Arundo donax TaxID=35708 RepID=A0A0A9H250_ARUDO
MIEVMHDIPSQRVRSSLLRQSQWETFSLFSW